MRRSLGAMAASPAAARDRGDTVVRRPDRCDRPASCRKARDEPALARPIGRERRDGDSTGRSMDHGGERAGSGPPTVMEADDAGRRAGIRRRGTTPCDEALRERDGVRRPPCAAVGQETKESADALGNMGAEYLRLGRYDQAEEYLREALIRRVHHDPSCRVSDILNNLGNCANLRGDGAGSLQYYQRALVDLRTKGGNDAEMADALYNIARAEIQSNNLTNAKRALMNTWKYTKRAYKASHPFAAQTLDLMGYVELQLGGYEAALVRFTQALGIYRRVHGPVHLDVANSLYHVGLVREAKGELGEAWESYNTARDLLSDLQMDATHERYRQIVMSIAQVESEILQASNGKRSSKLNSRRRYVK